MSNKPLSKFQVSSGFVCLCYLYTFYILDIYVNLCRLFSFSNIFVNLLKNG